ncbi:ribonuclease H-like domain-containing protein [Halohasta litorea]|uniref:Ribonuclease H-like domain-containing protein n=1 Tax=Halohasta litorea TaxID=869891 RepID=A0ABD6D763_9EURY|nr:ribonuclease H-like domain-containing protein [Halohasta litorea]
MPNDQSLELLSLPSQALTRLSQSAVQDTIQYFEPDLITIPGPRDAAAYAQVRDAAPDVFVIHPQLGRSGEHITHYRYSTDTGVREASNTTSEPGMIDVLAVQNLDILTRLQSELETNTRDTGSRAATFLILPQLSIEWNTTSLSTTLPEQDQLTAISNCLPEPVTVLAGEQPAEYNHEWTVQSTQSSDTLLIVGLGAHNQGSATVAQYSCTSRGTVAAEAVDASKFGLKALHGVGASTAQRLQQKECRTTQDVRNLSITELAELPGIGPTRAEKIHGHADVIESGEPLVLTNKTPIKTRGNQPPVCLDIETDGLSPTIIWQFGVYDPASDTHQAFIEKHDPKNPETVLEAFITWFIANHGNRTVLTWNGYGFDYPQIKQFLTQYCPEYLDAWDDVWTYDLYKWAVRDGNALLPGRTNKLDHVARALGYEAAGTGLTGAKTAAVYQEFMRNPDDPEREPDWERHKQYCKDDCQALWHVYQAITDAKRRDMTDSGTGGVNGQQAGLTDF